MVYSFSLFVSSKTRYHAEFQYIESCLYHQVKMYTISKALGLGPNLEAHTNERVVPLMKRSPLSQAEYGLIPKLEESLPRRIS